MPAASVAAPSLHPGAACRGRSAMQFGDGAPGRGGPAGCSCGLPSHTLPPPASPGALLPGSSCDCSPMAHPSEQLPQHCCTREFPLLAAKCTPVWGPRSQCHLPRLCRAGPGRPSLRFAPPALHGATLSMRSKGRPPAPPPAVLDHLRPSASQHRAGFGCRGHDGAGPLAGARWPGPAAVDLVGIAAGGPMGGFGWAAGPGAPP